LNLFDIFDNKFDQKKQLGLSACREIDHRSVPGRPPFWRLGTMAKRGHEGVVMARRGHPVGPRRWNDQRLVSAQAGAIDTDQAGGRRSVSPGFIENFCPIGGGKTVRPLHATIDINDNFADDTPYREPQP